MTVEVTRKPRTVGASHQIHAPRAVCVVTDIAQAVERICARILQTEASRGCGSYLYIDGQRNAYILTADATCAETWVRERFTWLVGFYARVGDGLQPTPEGLTEDIMDHLSSFDPQPAGGDNSGQPATDVAALQRSGSPGVISASGGGQSPQGADE